jgi:uncharacterized membrane protein YvlD (DUF360 family)
MRLLLRFALTTLLVVVLARAVPQYLVITGGWPAFIAVGALLTLLNLFARPFMNAIVLPLKLLFTLVAIILVNMLFLYITHIITSLFDPAIASLAIQGGLSGWLIVAMLLGLGNWAVKEIL